jgi:thiamine-monophosphate kinase
MFEPLALVRNPLHCTGSAEVKSSQNLRRGECGTLARRASRAYNRLARRLPRASPTSMRNEQQLIDQIRRAVPSAPRGAFRRELLLGIGDDAALLAPSRRAQWVLTCDAFLENVHFLPQVHPPESVGYKALARATSDLAAMGARPDCFLLSLALPAHCLGNWFDGFLRGLARAARRFGLVIAGGDTSRCASVAISITVLGTVTPRRAVLRSGARPGDLLYVSGVLGRAQLGLELILRGLYGEKRWRRLLFPHLEPPLRLELGAWLAGKRLSSAMIDTSDGFSTDLGHICAASRVGAHVWRDALPSVSVPPSLRARGFNAGEFALHGGEDYELLFTVPRRLAKKIPRRFRGVPLTPCGEITRERKILLVERNGRSSPLTPRGWDHFARPPRRRR